MTHPVTTAVVVTYRSAGIAGELCRTLGDLEGACGLVLVDSDSRDDTIERLRAGLPGVNPLSAGSNRGFGAACNLALSRVTTPYTLFLNPDARIDRVSLGMLEDRLRSEASTAAVQPLIRAWGWPGVTASRGIGITPFYEGFDLGFMRFEPWAGGGAPFRTSGVTAAVSLWRTEVLRSLEGFDPGIFMYFEDVDLSIRASMLGWGFEVLPGATAEHMVGTSSGRSRAELWELESSFRIAMRFSPDRARTIRRFVLREARSAVAIRRPGRALKRFARLFTGMAGRHPRAGRSYTPPAIRPADLPAVRSPKPFPLEPGGRLTTGPGWIGEGRFRGFGAFRSNSSGTFTAALRSDKGPATGRLWSDGSPGVPFSVWSAPARVSFELAPGRYYLAADDPEAAIHVEGATLDV